MQFWFTLILTSKPKTRYTDRTSYHKRDRTTQYGRLKSWYHKHANWDWRDGSGHYQIGRRCKHCI